MKCNTNIGKDLEFSLFANDKVIYTKHPSVPTKLVRIAHEDSVLKMRTRSFI